MNTNETPNAELTTPLPTREGPGVGLPGVGLLFPGSFDPFTVGHEDIVRRALAAGMADHVVVAIGRHPDKHDAADIDERLANIRRVFADDERVSVTSYEGLTADYARAIGATAILRGVRSVKDFEYERDLADINRQLSGIDTVILLSDPRYAAVSSSVVRELMRYGKDVSTLLPTTTK